MLRKVSMTALAILAVSALAFASTEQVVKGKVKAISGSTISVSSEDGQTLSFEVTGKTTVVAEGAGHKADRLSSIGQKTTLSEFVRTNQNVTLNYWEKDGKRYVAKLRVH